jgi:hypothetical protein
MKGVEKASLFSVRQVVTFSDIPNSENLIASYDVAEDQWQSYLLAMNSSTANHNEAEKMRCVHYTQDD